MKSLSYDYKKYKFPNDWNEVKISDVLELVERQIDLEDDKLYELVTVKRNFGGIKTRGTLEGKKILVKNQFILKRGDFVISKRQIAHGACGIVPVELDGAIVSNEYNVFRAKEGLDLEFFNLYCQLPFMKRNFYISSDGIHIEKLLFKTKDWMRRKIYIPVYNEQIKIYKIIEKLNLRIDLQKTLIENKAQYKNGLQQEILTGKIRINGFNEDWINLKLGTMFKERKETGYNDLELLAITSSKGVVRRTEVDIKDTSSEDKSKYKRILPGDIGYNTMRMWQGVSGMSKYEGIVSPAYTILDPSKEIDSEFISFIFKMPKVINLFHRYSQGLVSDTLNLKYENLKNIKLDIPRDKEEQVKLRLIFRIIEEEISILEKEFKCLTEKKKGIMQLLLTGIVRVK